MENRKTENTQPKMCVECEQLVLFEKYLQQKDGNYYCNKCFDELFIECYNCNECFEKDDITKHDDKVYCNDCFNESFFTCNECDDIYSIDDEQCYFDDKVYCNECFNELVANCSHCDEEFYRENMNIIYDEYYCNDCECGLFRVCDDCEEYVNQDDIYYCENDDCFYCENCYDNHIDEIIHDYGYKPTPKFYKDKNENDQLFFGFEIEIENYKNKYDNKEIAEDISIYKDIIEKYLYCKEDGSLINGFEIVSHPMTFQYFKKHETEIMEKVYELPAKGFTGFGNETCGMHVHLTDSMTNFHRYKMLKFFYENKTFIRFIGQRDYDGHLRNSKFDNTNLIKKCKKDFSQSRFECINLTNNKTIEIRIFKSNLSRIRILKNIEFCISSYWFTKNNSAKKLTHNDFKLYVEQNQKTYKNLYKYMKLFPELHNKFSQT